MSVSGSILLQNVAERIVARWLINQGNSTVRVAPGNDPRGVDLTYRAQGVSRSGIVKPDPYCGADPDLVSDRRLSFYRADAGTYGLEAVSDSITRAPGWAVESDADDIFYYFLPIAQPEEEVAALGAETDEVLFGELQVGRDDLVVIPGPALRAWFAEHAEAYTSRPVMGAASSSWHRVVPRAILEREVTGIRRIGRIFDTLQ